MPSPNTHFFRAFLRNKQQVGALTPSGVFLAEAMVDWFEWDTIRNVAELGPGTGVFTEKILEKIHPDGKFIVVERDEKLADLTRDRCPDASVSHRMRLKPVGRLPKRGSRSVGCRFVRIALGGLSGFAAT